MSPHNNHDVEIYGDQCSIYQLYVAIGTAINHLTGIKWYQWRVVVCSIMASRINVFWPVMYQAHRQQERMRRE